MLQAAQGRRTVGDTLIPPSKVRFYIEHIGRNGAGALSACDALLPVLYSGRAISTAIFQEGRLGRDFGGRRAQLVAQRDIGLTAGWQAEYDTWTAAA